MHRIPSLALCITLVWALSAVAPAHGQPGTVLSHQKISDTEGGLTGTLDNFDLFGYSAASLGDLDGDGVGDLAVGALLDDDGSIGPCDDPFQDCNRGAVWVLFLNTDGTVKSHQKISDTAGGFTGILDDRDWFGNSVASLDDLDGDGVGDLAVGARHDDDVGSNRGAVWILFLNSDGTVKSHQKISDTDGGFMGVLDNIDEFGTSVASLGDLDGDGVGDLAVGAVGDDDGGTNRGAVWVLFLNTDGTVKSHQKISDTEGGFTGVLDNFDRFGFSVASLGDLDGDGVGDLAVGAHLDDDGGLNQGAVWVLFLHADGTVKSHQKISDTQGGFTGILDAEDFFGVSVASLHDLDGDGVGDLAVGATLDDDGGFNRGAVWILFVNANGTVKEYQKISDTQGGFMGVLDDFDAFGWSVASLADLDGDGVGDLAVGAHLDDDGGVDSGAVWVLLLDGVPQSIPPSLDIQPGSCPNPFNRHGNGVLPVALVGTVEFDPTEVDLSTLQLSRADGVGGSVAPNEGPPGPHSVFEDVATPFDGKGCECHDLGGDGIDDLSMKFKTRDLVDALELDELPGGAVVELVLSGSLLDGTPFVAGDCIVIVPPGDLGPMSATVGSNVGDTFIEVTPLDLNIDSDGFTSFGRAYYPGTLLTVTAPPTSEGRRFVRWRVDGVLQEIGVRTIEVAVAEDTTLQALYHLQRRLRPDRPTESDEPLD